MSSVRTLQTAREPVTPPSPRPPPPPPKKKKHTHKKKKKKPRKDLTNDKQGQSTTMQEREGTSLTEKKDILNRWTECCLELYNHKATKIQEELMFLLHSTSTTSPSYEKELRQK